LRGAALRAVATLEVTTMTSKTSERFFERVAGPPIPPVKENMETFEAGPIRIGVEFRVITDEIVGALGLSETAAANEYRNLNDNGVSIHVFVKVDNGERERVRFDCFQEDPHYHYFSADLSIVDIIHIDPSMTGDPLAWVLERIGTRLPQLLQRAGVENGAQLVERESLERILPMVTEAAYRLRYGSNKERIHRGALDMARRLIGKVEQPLTR
jgi:hypothetical protein